MPESNIGLQTLPRVAAGYLKIVLIRLPDGGGYIPLLADQASWADSKQWQFTNYALNPPVGPKQKTIHSIGTREVRISISGQLTKNSFDLAMLMNPANRGKPLPEVFIQQGNRDVWLFENVYWSNFTLSGQEGGNIGFSFEGKATTPPQPTTPRVQTVIPTPIPSWYSGNTYVTGWQINHSVPLIPVWANSFAEYPKYYRVGSSEYTMNLSTAFQIEAHNTVQIAVNQFTMIEALVQERTYELGSGRTDSAKYNVALTNCRFYRVLEGADPIKYRGRVRLESDLRSLGRGQPPPRGGEEPTDDKDDKNPKKQPLNYLPPKKDFLSNALYPLEMVDTRKWKLDAFQPGVEYLLVGNNWPQFLPDGVYV